MALIIDSAEDAEAAVWPERWHAAMDDCSAFGVEAGEAGCSVEVWRSSRRGRRW